MATSIGTHYDRNGGRPQRINQWNIAVQRELVRNLALEAAYVGNRGVWIEANSDGRNERHFEAAARGSSA